MSCAHASRDAPGCQPALDRGSGERVAGDRRARRRGTRRPDRRRGRADRDSGPMISRNSTTEPGQPWVTISGSAPGSGDGAWMKCTRVPSISVRKWSNALSAPRRAASRTRRASTRRARPGSRARCRSPSPRRAAVPGGGCGSGARAGRRGRRLGIAIVNGSMASDMGRRYLSPTLAPLVPSQAAEPPSRLPPQLSPSSRRTRRITWITPTRSPRSSDPRRRHGCRDPQRHRTRSKTLRNLDWFEVTDVRGAMNDGDIAWFQVTMKVGFRLDDGE